jgi:hypothetical protein
MTIIKIDTGKFELSEEKKKLILEITRLVGTGRLDQLRYILSKLSRLDLVSSSVSHVHNELFTEKNKLLIDKNKRTIWDEQITLLKNEKAWTNKLFQMMINEYDRKIIQKHQINKSTEIASIGSCFATNISLHLKKMGYMNTSTLRVEEAINSPSLICMYLNSEQIKERDREIWDARFGIESKKMLQMIPDFKIIILTFGVSWDLVDEDNNIIVNPINIFNGIKENIYRFKKLNVEEQSYKIIECIQKIKKLNSTALIFVSISPVPLSGYIGELNVIEANLLSKSNLIEAVNIAKSKENFIYLPVYEAIHSIAPLMGIDRIWGDQESIRHPHRSIIEMICTSFVSLFDQPIETT